MHAAARAPLRLLLALAAFAVPGLALPLAAQEPDPAAPDPAAEAMAEAVRIDLSFKLPAAQQIEVDNPYGNVYLRFGGYEHQLDVRATVQRPEGAPEFSFAPAAEGGVFRVVPSLPAGATPAATQRIDLVLYAPEGHPLRVRTASGSIESRGVRADVDFRSQSGDIVARGTVGAVRADTASGAIRLMLEPTAASVRQRYSTRTGDISVGVTDALGAELRMSTSGSITTDYSIEITARDGEEPDKRGIARVGVAKGAQPGVIEVDSLRGNLRLWRRPAFVEAAPPQGDADAP